jgi:hypothetical protein
MYKDCNYINASTRPKGLEGNPEIFENINQKVNSTAKPWMLKRKEKLQKESNYNSDIKSSRHGINKISRFFRYNIQIRLFQNGISIIPHS